MEKNTVKYDNYLNTIHFGGLKSNELNVIMALCAKMKECGTERVKFSYNELKQCMFKRKVSDEELRKTIRSAAKKLGDVNGEVELTDGRIVYFDLFPTRTDNPNDRSFLIRVNDDVKFILNDLTKNFTTFELNEFVELSGKYSKHLYRILKQFRSTGKCIINIADLKENLDIPRQYTNKRINYEVLPPAIEELQKKELFKNLVCTPQKAKKRGLPVIGYTFTFEPEHRERKPSEQSKQPDKKSDKKLSQPAQKEVGYVTKSAKAYNNYSQRHYTDEELEELEERLLQKEYLNVSQ